VFYIEVPSTRDESIGYHDPKHRPSQMPREMEKERFGSFKRYGQVGSDTEHTGRWENMLSDWEEGCRME